MKQHPQQDDDAQPIDDAGEGGEGEGDEDQDQDQTNEVENEVENEQDNENENDQEGDEDQQDQTNKVENEVENEQDNENENDEENEEERNFARRRSRRPGNRIPACRRGKAVRLTSQVVPTIQLRVGKPKRYYLEMKETTEFHLMLPLNDTKVVMRRWKV